MATEVQTEIQSQILDLDTPCTEVIQDSVVPFTKRAYIFYWLVPYCTQTFDLSNPYHRSSYLYWLVCNGADYGYDNSFEVNQVNQWIPFLKLADFTLLLPKRSLLFWTSFPEVKERFDLNLFEGVCGFVRFLLFEQEIKRFAFSEEEKNYLVRGCVTGYPNQYARLSNLGIFIWLCRSDLQAVYPLQPKWESFFDWIITEGIIAYLPWLKQFLGEELLGASNPFIRVSGESNLDLPQPPTVDNKLIFEGLKLSDGVCVVGYAQSEIGTGEDSRTVSRAIANLGYSVSVYPIIPDSLRPAVNHSVDDLISYKLDKKVTIFNTPTIETMHLLMNKGQPFHSNGSYLIGYWAWELPQWRSDLKFCFDYVDEVWASTKFIQDCFSKVTRKPVIHMPLPVILPEFKKMSRCEFQLPEDRYLFFYNFDFNSSIHRKNPVAFIEAFKAAFPEDQKVGLVIKTKCTYEHNDLWKRILAEARQDSRIYIFNSSFSTDQMYSLVDCIDCYVSLHRSEGFGRTIAEAMLLKKPTIVTNYSGNTDFCNNETSMLVDFDLVKVQPGEYPHSVGFEWANPSVEDAARKMLKVYRTPKATEGIVEQAYQNIKNHYSLEALGPKYLARLKQVSI